MNFSNYYYLNEINKNILKTNTDDGRIHRAINDIKTHRRQLRFRVDNNGNNVLEYDFRANPSTEFRNHWGYVIYKNDDIKELFCCCKDFFYRLYAPLVKNKLATWTPPKKFIMRMKKFNGVHNKEWTKIRNPTGDLYVCKHLYALIHVYVNTKIDPRPLAGVKINKSKRHVGIDDVLNKDMIDSKLDKKKGEL